MPPAALALSRQGLGPSVHATLVGMTGRAHTAARFIYLLLRSHLFSFEIQLEGCQYKNEPEYGLDSLAFDSRTRATLRRIRDEGHR